MNLTSNMFCFPYTALDGGERHSHVMTVSFFCNQFVNEEEDVAGKTGWQRSSGKADALGSPPPISGFVASWRGLCPGNKISGGKLFLAEPAIFTVLARVAIEAEEWCSRSPLRSLFL